MNSPSFYFAKEGHRGFLLLVALIALSLIFEFKTLAFLLFCLCALWVYLFRDLERHSSYLASNAFLSPIDGKVTQLVFQRGEVFITIKVNFFGVGVLRAPIDIDAPHLSRIFGSPLFFSSQKALLAPQSTMHFGEHMMQVTQSIFHFSPFGVAKSFRQGERMGFLKAGEVVLRIKNLETKVNIGDQLKGGESVIGYLQ